MWPNCEFVKSLLEGRSSTTREISMQTVAWRFDYSLSDIITRNQQRQSQQQQQQCETRRTVEQLDRTACYAVPGRSVGRRRL